MQPSSETSWSVDGCRGAIENVTVGRVYDMLTERFLKEKLRKIEACDFEIDDRVIE